MPRFYPDVHAKIDNELCNKVLQNIKETPKAEFTSQLSQIYDLDALDPYLEDPKCGKCGKAAVQRCSRCRLEWY